MAKYTVIWDRALEADLTDMWNKSDSSTRAIITRLAAWIDGELAIDPEDKGQWRPELQARVITVPIAQARVAVVFEVLPADRKVLVTRIHFRSKR